MTTVYIADEGDDKKGRTRAGERRSSHQIR